MTRQHLRSALLVTPVLALAASLAIAWDDSPENRSDSKPPAAREKAGNAEGAEQPPEQTPLQKFMRVKLDASSLVLEGLVTERFKLIEKGADQLQQTSEADQWRASNDALYRQYSREFQAKVKDLHQAAEDKNVDRAALAWMDTTLTCVECHKWVNAMLIARRPLFHGIDTPARSAHGLGAQFAARRSGDLPPGSAAGHDQPRVPIRTIAVQPDAEQRVSRFMREKLDSAQDVLEGVLVEDFDLVTKGARRMAIMSQATEWHVFDTPQYREDSAEFRAKCRELLKAADEQRTDAAALSYLQLTLSCVRCHEHMRHKQVAARPLQPATTLAGNGL